MIPHTLTNEENNKSYVKIVTNQNNNILYLTRADAPSPFRSKRKPFLRHQDFCNFQARFYKNLRT